MREWITQFFRYGCVGALGAVVNLSVFNLLLMFGYFHTHFVQAAVMSFLSAVGVTYMGNVLWTFSRQAKRHPRQQQMTIFFIISVFVLAMNCFILHYCVMTLGWDRRMSNVVAIGLCSFINFTANRRLTFSR